MKILEIWFVVLIAMASACVTQAYAQHQWNLTDSQFVSSTVTILSADAHSLNVARIDGTPPMAVGWDDLVQIAHDADGKSATAGQCQIYLVGGNRLSGEPVELAGEKLTWKSAILGEIQIPLDQVLAIGRTGSPEPRWDETHADDVAHLANGDTMHGIVTQIAPTGPTLEIGSNTVPLQWESITNLLLSGSAAAPKIDARSFRVSFVGGESVSADAVSFSADRFDFTLADGTHVAIDAGSVAGIEVLNGPVSWLTSRAPAENVYRPFFSEHFPARFDRTFDDRPIAEAFPAFHHGIACHSYSKLVYNLEGAYAGFRTQFTLDTQSALADVTIRVLLDDKPVVERKNIRAGQVYPLLIVPLGDAKKLTLEVDYGQNDSTADRFVWLDPALIRKLPAPQ